MLAKYEKRLLLIYIHNFKSDLINVMNRMRISDTEPSSAVKRWKLMPQKYQDKLKTNGMVW